MSSYIARKQYNTKTFQIGSSQDAENFAAHINRYAEIELQINDIAKHFGEIFNYSRIHTTDPRTNGRLLNSYIDLMLTHLFMFKDVLLASDRHNKLLEVGKYGAGSILDDFEIFSKKMDMLNSLTSFSLRSRAYWDKYMGILILLYEHQEYEKYVDASSRKTTFFKHAKAWPGLSVDLRRCLTRIANRLNGGYGSDLDLRKTDDETAFIRFPSPFLEDFREIIEMTDTFRTPEAHGAGRLRKWTLANLPIEESKDFDLLGLWNFCNDFMIALQKTILTMAAKDL